MSKIIVSVIGILIISAIYLNTALKEKSKKEQKIELIKKETLNKLSKIQTSINKAYQNKDIKKLKYLKKEIINIKPFNNKYNLIIDNIDNYINKLKKSKKEEEIKRKLSIKLNKIQTSIKRAYQNKDIEKLKYLKTEIINMKALSNKYKLTIDNIDNYISVIDVYIKNIKNFKNKCIDKYSNLEKKYEAAIGFLFNNKIEITQVQNKVLKLKNSNCYKFISTDIDNLINKCNNELK